MELAFTGLNPVTKEVQREDEQQRYSQTCTYTASKPLHCESCTYTWQSQAVNLDKHVLLHLGVCLGLSQQSNRGNMQQTFFAILLLLARSKNVPSNGPTNQWTNTTSHEKCAHAHPIADTLVIENAESHSVSTSGRELGSPP